MIHLICIKRESKELIKVNFELTQLSKESSRVNAQLVPRFEEKTPYHNFGVHFWGTRIWTGNFGDKNFGRQFLEANFKRRILGKIFRGKILKKSEFSHSFSGILY